MAIKFYWVYFFCILIMCVSCVFEMIKCKNRLTMLNRCSFCTISSKCGTRNEQHHAQTHHFHLMMFDVVSRLVVTLGSAAIAMIIIALLLWIYMVCKSKAYKVCVSQIDVQNLACAHYISQPIHLGGNHAKIGLKHRKLGYNVVKLPLDYSDECCNICGD